jgi:hypothetical protein
MKTKSYSPNDPGQPKTRHPLGWCLLTLFLALASTGCQHEPKVAANAIPGEVFTLVSVNGKQVPCTLTHEGVTMIVKSGAFTLTGDGTCSSKMDFFVEARGDASREVQATYTREGAKLTMKWKGAGITTGRIDGNTFTMNNEDMVLAYQK